MKKLLFQLDTDPTPNILDAVIAYDGGADHVLSYGNIKPSTAGIVIDSAWSCAAGVELLHEDAWKDLPELEILMDANATPCSTRLKFLNWRKPW